MTGARRTNIKEPVEVDNPEASENDTNDNPEVIEDDESEPAEDSDEPDDETADEGQGSVPDTESETEDEVVPDWFVGQPCLNCGARNYRYSVGWGAACSVCLNPPADEE